MFMPAASPDVDLASTGTEEPKKIETADDLHQEILTSLVEAGQSKKDLMKNRLANRVFTHMMRNRMFSNATTATVNKAVIDVLDALQ